jgi:hypothetical protein
VAEKEHLIEAIKYRVEWLRLLWITMLAVGSGVIGLLLGGMQSPLAGGFAAAGLFLLVLFGGLIARLDGQIRAAIEKLKEVSHALRCCSVDGPRGVCHYCRDGMEGHAIEKHLVLRNHRLSSTDLATRWNTCPYESAQPLQLR